LKIKLFLEGRPTLATLLRRVAAWSFVYVRAICVQARDIKVLIAFSSVAHMAFVVIGLLSGSLSGVLCAYLVLMRHGIRSSAGFFFAFLLYQTRQTRSIILNKAANTSRGVMILYWTIICLGLMGAPPSFNLWVEICSFLVFILAAPGIAKLLF